MLQGFGFVFGPIVYPVCPLHLIHPRNCPTCLNPTRQTPRGAAAKLVVLEVHAIMFPALRSSFASVDAQILTVNGNHFYFACDRIPYDAKEE